MRIINCTTNSSNMESTKINLFRNIKLIIMEDKKLFNENESTYNASKQTQNLSSKATIEKYDYKLDSDDYASVDHSLNEINQWWGNGNMAIQTCMKKVDFNEMNNIKMRNCLKKIKQGNEFFMMH